MQHVMQHGVRGRCEVQVSKVCFENNGWSGLARVDHSCVSTVDERKMVEKDAKEKDPNGVV